MRIQKTRVIISFLIIASMLISPFNGISIIANATENENNDSKTIKKIEVILKEASGGNPRKIFYKANSDEASEDTLDLDDIIIKASYDDDSTKDISLPSSDYDITTNINEVRAIAADNQKLTAAISIKGADNNETKLASTNDPTVTILPAKTVTPKKISLKLKDAKRTSFYVASDFISANDNNMLMASTLNHITSDIECIHKTATSSREIKSKSIFQSKLTQYDRCSRWMNIIRCGCRNH